MPTVQSTYSATLSKARAGMRASMEDVNLISRTVESAAGIAFGAAVAQGTTGDTTVRNTTTGVTAILGIAVREASATPEFPNGFAQYQEAGIMTKGPIWVTAGEAVAAGDPVYVTVASGAFGKTSGAGIVQIPNARWDTSASSGALAVVRLG